MLRRFTRGRALCYRVHPMQFTQIAGILPAVVFPAATLAQLIRMLRQRSALGVSTSTWLLFGFANLAIYIYTERYAEWQAIFGMLFTAVLDFVIVILARYYHHRTDPAARQEGVTRLAAAARATTVGP